jgi:hypothetical protein
MIIGQKNLLQQIDNLIENNFPRFSILHGPKGSGKKLISAYIAEKLGITLVPCGIKVDEVRQVIQAAYTDKIPSLYLFPDADNMSLNAKNAMLKITEEPPTNSYFIMTVCDTNRMLGTILSRGVLFNIDPYTPQDIMDCIEEMNLIAVLHEPKLVSQICQAPGDIDTLISYNIDAFYEFCEQVLDNISEVDGANAFKIGLRLDTKGTGEGGTYDLRLFFNTISIIALNRLKQEKEQNYYEVIKLCSKFKQELNITGISKLSLIDNWIMEMRKVL